MKSIFEKLRKDMNKSQQEVAVKMGLSLTAYRNKEKQRSRFFVDEIPSFSDAIGMKLDDAVKRIFFE